MRHSYLIPLLLLLSVSFLPSCLFEDNDDEEVLGNWIRRSDFEGVPRSNAVSFTINNISYVGLGYDGEDDLNDFWQYDPELDFWQKVDTFPGVPRRAAVAFSVGGKGYVGTGYNADLPVEELRDFWEFDPQAPSGQQWTQKADFMGTARYNAIGFAINDKGYIGTGYDNNWLKDFYAYDPTTDSWEQVVSLGGAKRENAFAFVINGVAYVGGGRNNGIYETDFWSFEPGQQLWTRLEDLDEDDEYELIRDGALGLGSGATGFVIGGTSGSTLGTVWEYDPLTDTWEEKNSMEGAARTNLTGFVVESRIFIVSGEISGTRLDDIWEFRPYEELDEDD